MKRCKHCNAELPDQALVCNYCGEPVEELQEETPQVPNPMEPETKAEDTSAAKDAGQGEGYWQFGTWHSVDELNNQSAVHPDGTQQGYPPVQQPWDSGNANSDNRQQSWQNGTYYQQGPQNSNYYQQNPQNAGNWNPNGWNQNPWNYGGYQNQVPQRTSGFAIAALVLGILSVFLNVVYMVPSVLAIVFGIIAIVQINRNPMQFKGKGLAIAGIVIGVIFFCLYLYIFIAAIQLMKDPQFQQIMQEYMQELTDTANGLMIRKI